MGILSSPLKIKPMRLSVIDLPAKYLPTCDWSVPKYDKNKKVDAINPDQILKRSFQLKLVVTMLSLPNSPANWMVLPNETVSGNNL